MHRCFYHEFCNKVSQGPSAVVVIFKVKFLTMACLGRCKFLLMWHALRQAERLLSLSSATILLIHLYVL